MANNTDLWTVVHQRLKSIRTTIERGFVPTLDEKKQILASRARMLAQESSSRKSEEAHIQVLEFLVGSENYAVESMYIGGVYPFKKLTPLPWTPPFVLGIINVRGQIVSVISIEKLFNMPEEGLTSPNNVIIMHSDDMELGILADSILGVCSILLKEIQSPPPILKATRVQYLKGITKKQLLIIDAAKLLSDKNIVVHEEV